MGGVSWKGGSWEVAKPTTNAQLKMEEVCILYDVIETFLMKKSDQGRKMRAFCPLQALNDIGIIMLKDIGMFV
jgi:hypothetical protein